MMNDSVPLYALPLPTVSHHASKIVKQSKRKRTPVEDDSSDPDFPSRDVEYSAIVTPEERIQRRLAGQPLNEQPPSFPFPHAPAQTRVSKENDGRSTLQTSGNVSLRMQHLSNMIAVLHKCLANRDYVRATRALALILRTEMHGKTIDLRHADLWGIGAELLFRSTVEPGSNMITREGLEKARTFFDRMSLQHPWHRSWPDVINAQDFKVAFFGLWVYVVNQESRRLHNLTTDEMDDERQQVAKEWEFAEAENIARELDSVMSTLPFMDDPELIRLRAMVALWTADLIESLDDLQQGSLDPELELERAWMGDPDPDPDQRDNTPSKNSRAEAVRATARKMFAKVKINSKNEDEDPETSFD